MKRLLLAIWILFALHSAFYADASASYAGNTEDQISVTLDDTEESKDQQLPEYQLQIDKTFSTNFHLDFHADLNFEFEFPLVLDNSPNGLYSISVENTEYFKTLFHYIISPNAP